MTFVSVCCPDILTVKATASDPRTGTRYTDPRSVVTALDRVVRITPVDLALQDYRATIDITDILRDDLAEFPNGYTRSDGSQSATPCCFTDNVAARVEMLRSQRFPTATGAFALWSGQLVGGQGLAGAGWTSDNPDRPLTNMGHEFQHSLGRQHYATACGAGSNADPGDPDRIGLINGVGDGSVGGTPVYGADLARRGPGDARRGAGRQPRRVRPDVLLRPDRRHRRVDESVDLGVRLAVPRQPLPLPERHGGGRDGRAGAPAGHRGVRHSRLRRLRGHRRGRAGHGPGRSSRRRSGS